MAPIDIDLGGFTTARGELDRLAARQRAADQEVAAAKGALGAATRAGVSPDEIGPLAARVDEAQAARSALVQQRRAVQERLGALAERLVRNRDPAELVGSLDGHQPIALLPVRIETRYVPVGRPDRLRIRVYPDDIHTIDHEAAPTPDEQQAAMAYWTARFAGNDDEAARLLRDLARSYGRGRAAWLVRVLTPTNPLPPPGQQGVPAFRAIDTIDTFSKATRAVLLPERWCAVGYAAGRVEVFRVWGKTIPDELVLSPDWLATDQPEALLGGDRAWMVDFDAALANGMALEVTQQDVAGHFDLATGTLERLVVVGFEWTKGAADSAGAFADLLAAHRDSSGFGFASLGTPTNNTEAARSGHSAAAKREPPPPAPNAPPEDQDALQLLHWACGLAPGALPADNIDQPHLTDQRSALHMMNLLWRGTFGDYLLQRWNPLVDGQDVLDTAKLFALRRYAASYVRPTGPLPILRFDDQPYGILPLVGRRFVDPGGSPVETAIGKVLGVLRPMWELASAGVPRLVDGDVEQAKSILQTAAWSQTAFYRDKDANAMCIKPSPVSGAQTSGRTPVIQNLLAALGPYSFYNVDIGVCNDFLPDPPYSAGYLAGVPWVLADEQDPTKEAAADTTFVAANDYLSKIGAAAIQTPAAGKADLDKSQAGPALLQALAAYSVQKEQNDAVDRFLVASGALNRVLSRTTTIMPYVEELPQNEAMFTVETPKELASLSVPAVSGRATLGEHVANTLAAQLPAPPKSLASNAASGLFDGLQAVLPQTRDLGGVKLSLDFLATRTVGELNVAFRSTLDAFSYRLDAWITARANRRLEQIRAARPQGLYVGGYAWVENLKADARPDSEGFLLAPSQAQAATAALLRSGFMANHEQGAFDIALDSRRTRRALDILQGLTRDQPLAALYGYRIERALRDAGLGKFIWPLRLAYPWRPGAGQPDGHASDAIGARDVVDGVALLADWESTRANPATDPVFTKLDDTLAKLDPAQPAANGPERSGVEAILDDALDLADSVSDLLLAEGAHQVVQGNPARAAAAMAVADKQSLPIETQVDRTPRGGASYTQRIVALCPSPIDGWPEDRRARAEPALNAWLASMLGDPTRYRFTARVHRAAPDGAGDVIDADLLEASWADLGLSPLSAVLLCDGPTGHRLSGPGETGLRSAVASALIAKLGDPANVKGLDIDPLPADGALLGLAQLEAIAMTLKAVVDKSRFATRKDLVSVDDKLEATLPPMGEYAGVDVAEIVTRAGDLVGEFDTARNALLASVGADALLAALDGFSDFLPPSAWPAQVFAIDAPGADPGTRDARAAEAIEALTPLLAAIHDDVQADPPLLEGQIAATDAQRAQHAIAGLKRLFGKDFPVLPRFVLGPYSTEFNASLAEQDVLAASDPWRIHGWLTQVARVRDGADRLAAAISAHEALCAPLARGDLKLVQFPHRTGQVWAALPEAWREDEGTPFDPAQVPEELRDYLAARPGAPYRDIQRVAPHVAIALHAPALAAIAADESIAAFVCDDWPEFIPDPFQTAAIAFHYDAPGARPPQTILLALPPKLDQAAWSFDDALDVIHEAFDLAKLRGVRPRDLAGGLGALLPGNFLPQIYTDDLPSVRVLEMMREALLHVVSASAQKSAAFALGKI
ncbi:MAG TPA: hypothetical protein VMW35_16160 [Myxococcota bacterium]|nr:hypothetical protein [Myxococcota bacterium]